MSSSNLTPTDSGSSLPGKRRQTLLSRARPRTAIFDKSHNTDQPRPQTGSWFLHADEKGSTAPPFDHAQFNFFDHDKLKSEGVESVDSEHVFEDDTVPFPEMAAAPSKHRPSKSFSSLRHGVSELRAAARRLSLTIRHKSSRPVLEIPAEGDNGSPSTSRSGSASHYLGEEGCDQRSKTGWFRSQRAHRQPSLSSLNALNNFYSPAYHVTSPIPGNGTEPPILPESLEAGSAARAAAAAQNEMAKVGRVISKGDPRAFDFKVSTDSESGIGIDMRDRVDGSEGEREVIRQDPIQCLPTELMAHILSYLDPSSLINAQLVSRDWNQEASSHHIWRDVFRKEFNGGQSLSKSTKKKRALGLGKTVPNQDWRQMYFIRQRLERRWKEGSAAAIYLHGHKDSVYCVQFDENKIITGSRDQTIRIWDAHAPWQCLKIIGAPPEDTPSTTTPADLNNNSQSEGLSPFVSVFPHSPPAADIVAPLSHTSDYHRASILCLQFDDEIMVTGSSDFTCIVWDVKNDYKAIRRLCGHTAGVLDVCFDDRYIVSCSKDTSICVWDRHTGDLIKKLTGHTGPVNAVQLRGDLIVSASGDGKAKLWNITSGLCIKKFPGKEKGLACVEFSEDGRTIFAGGNDQVIYQFDANTGEMVNKLKGHTGLVRSLHLDDDHKRVVSGSYDMSIKVFNSETGELSIDLPEWTTSWMLSAKSDYRRIVATSQDADAVIMDFGYGLDGIELLEE
ncbi:hypothetical protein FQN54_005084 [Arachnomyces sp. PD_36]|nr:hypothetical protein FQN54_005084 [Arachnomyces sp. PD_36]